MEVKHKLKCFTLGGAIKSGIVERYKSCPFSARFILMLRFNRTLKQRIARYMTQNHTKIWVDILADMTNLYNNTVHRSTGYAPNDVTFANAEKIRQKLYGHKGKSDCKLKIGDIVRVAIKKNLFDKGYDIGWSKDLFTISKVESSFGRCWYKGKIILMIKINSLFKVQNQEKIEQKDIYYKQQLNLIARS